MKLQLQLDRPLVVFDIESTGVNARQDRIIELAAIRIETDGTETEKCWLLNPGVPIPPETTIIHGISDEMVKDCPTFADKAEEIAAFFKDCDLSGFNSDRFDIPCLEEEFARVGMNLGASDRRHVDVQRIYHKREPRDLTAAVKFYCGRDHVGAHGAEADARATLTRCGRTALSGRSGPASPAARPA
jgi:DNA polymerase-3 subunit epsilon